MALELSINVALSSNGKVMTFTETTGAYDATLNPTGWGSPNLELTDISEAKLEVTKPDSTTRTLFYTKGQYYGTGFSPNFPDKNGTYTFDITAAFNSKFSLTGININTPSAGYINYSTYMPHNFVTSDLVTTKGYSYTAYNVSSLPIVGIGTSNFWVSKSTTLVPFTAPNPLAYTVNTTTDGFEDGIYKFVYTLASPNKEGTDDKYTATFYILITTAISCCVDKLFHLASQADCTDCKSEKLNKALEAESYLKAAEYAAACGKVNMANKHVAKAQWICSEQNCLNC